MLALEEWGGEDTAMGITKGAPVSIICAAVLRVTLVTVEGRKVPQLFRFKVFRFGTCGWKGLIVGGPALEQAPVGLGFRPSLAGHVLDALGVVLPRVEEPEVASRMCSFGCLFGAGPPSGDGLTLAELGGGRR